MVIRTDSPPDDADAKRRLLDKVEAEIAERMAVRAYLRRDLGIADPSSQATPPSLPTAIDAVLRSSPTAALSTAEIARRINEMDNRPACVVNTTTVTKCLHENAEKMAWQKMQSPRGGRFVVWGRVAAGVGSPRF